jgi:23S rRNA pseudouridine1911/1915/1917 synthase
LIAETMIAARRSRRGGLRLCLASCLLQHSACAASTAPTPPAGLPAARAELRVATHARLGCEIAAPAGPGGVAHIRTSDAWCAPAAESVAALLELPAERAEWLCAMGAVYLDGARVLAPSAPVGGGAHVRVHTNPKRFAAAGAVDWLAAVHHDEPAEFVVLEKPRGVPTHATLDNVRETCQARLSAALGAELSCPHRLDVATRGLLVLARTPAFLAAFNAELRERRVRKVYAALCAPGLEPSAPLPEGGARLSHWILPGPRAPTLLAPRAAPKEPGWRECECEVLSAREVLASLPAERAAGLPARRLVEVRLLLQTGRTHQLRNCAARSHRLAPRGRRGLRGGWRRRRARARARRRRRLRRPRARAGGRCGAGAGHADRAGGGSRPLRRFFWTRRGRARV